VASDNSYPKLRRNTVIKSSDDELGFTTSCLSCVSFVEQTEFCKKFKARPPARIIAFGCSEYFDNEEIPF
jgi:hypothetical protein